jgi:phosphoribosylformylglycinamidine synthase
MKAPAGIAVHGRGDAEVRAALQRLGVHLKLDEVRHLAAVLERDPSLAELALLDSMWSEHCSYKSSRALLRRLPTQAPHVVLGPGADAGIVRLPQVDPDGRARLESAATAAPGARCICIGHESHNHPSQLLPVEGAATGIGGIVRDVYCMGADVVGVLDALRFGDPDGAQAESVRQIVRGVVRGIGAYGNALGVPNLGGDVEFDAAFDDNCLVNVVALGILDERDLVQSVAPAAAGREPYVLLLVGKPTDDSGLGGAAFASGVLDTDETTQQRGAVQLPDPFFKRVLTEANRAVVARLRAHGAPFAIKDLGAAGLGGAASEMAAGAGLGLALDLDAVHRDRDRPAAVLLVAETQERYALAVPAGLADDLIAVYERDFELGHMVRGGGARVVGRFQAQARFQAQQAGRLEVDLPASLITEALEASWPRAPRPARARRPAEARAGLEGRDVERDLELLVGSPGAASRHWIFAHFDSDVQGRSLLRPGDADAGALVLRRDEPLGVAVGLGGSARWGRRDAYRAGAAAVCEAARNVASVGATPWALTDCLNYGSPENPVCMQDLDDGVQGLADAARALGVRGLPGAPLPFVSGNVSLYNESRAGRAIPPMPIVACLGVLCDLSRARAVRLESAGNRLYMLREPGTGLGASLYAQVTGQTALFEEDDLPPLDFAAESRRQHAILAGFDAGLVRTGHDVGDGGLVLALVEMTFGRRAAPELGVRARLAPAAAPLAAQLFSEAPGFVCEVRVADAPRFEALCVEHGAPAELLGEVLDEPRLVVEAAAGRLDVALAPLAARWLDGLAPVLRGREAP